MNILCTICARKGSKGVPGKNLAVINGMPLINHSIIQAQKSNIFDKIVVSSDCEDILFSSSKVGIKSFFKRSKLLSSDKASKVDVIKDALLLSQI